jgi:hypothetical protein
MQALLRGSRRGSPGEALFAQFWKLDAGLRYLRMIDPDYAEYGYAFSHEQTRLQLDLIDKGKLKQNGDFNVIRREVSGRKRYITFFSGGAGRSWKAEIPEEYKTLPTIEPQVPEAASLTGVHDYVFGVATSLSNDTGRETLSRLQSIKEHRAPLWLPSDLSPMTTKSASPLEARQRAQTAVLIMDFLDNVAPLGNRSETDSNRAEGYATRLQNAYGNAGLNGSLYWPILLLLEIVQIGKPKWPFGEGLPRFVCGQSNCNHVICGLNIRHVLGEAVPSAILAPMVSRDLHAYFLKNEADLTELLRLAINSAGGPSWIERAARQLLDRGKIARSKLTDAKSVLDFYTMHFRYVPSFKAAQIGFDFLASVPAATERQSEFQKLSNEAEEFGARALSALSFDFENAVDQLPVMRMRELYSFVTKESRIAANAMLLNWIENETLIPGFWHDFVTGKSDSLPSHAAVAPGS